MAVLVSLTPRKRKNRLLYIISYTERSRKSDHTTERPPQQGRRRLFKSGPAEEAIECRRHERGRAREGFGGPLPSPPPTPHPRENF